MLPVKLEILDQVYCVIFKWKGGIVLEREEYWFSKEEYIILKLFVAELLFGDREWMNNLIGY